MRSFASTLFPPLLVWFTYDAGAAKIQDDARDQTILSNLPQAQGVKERPGRLPALGFNSWNAFHCDIDESKFLDAATRMIDLGLKDVGYEYVNIDDCWAVKNKRDESTGYMIPDPKKFPRGISGTAETIHRMGLKIGIYSSAGAMTCALYPASLEHEQVDAKSFAEWGIDYLKYDNCFYEVVPGWRDECEYCQSLNSTCHSNSGVKYCPAGYDYSKSKNAERYKRMRRALDQQSRPILYSLCQWGRAGVAFWAGDVAESWRSTDDIEPTWSSILAILNENSFYLNYVGFYAHADPDMLEVGNGDLTLEEQRSHFALWAAMKSPLLIGTDLTKIGDDSLRILKSKTLLAFNQDDVHEKPAMPFKWGTNPKWTFDEHYPAEFWSGTFKGGIMMLLLNNSDEPRRMQFAWREVPEVRKGQMYRIVDGWDEGIDYGCFQVEGVLTVGLIARHDTAVLVLKRDSKCEGAVAGGLPKSGSTVVNGLQLWSSL